MRLYRHILNDCRYLVVVLTIDEQILAGHISASKIFI